MVSLPPEMWQAIEDFRFDNRFRSEAEAIRVLVERGIAINALIEIIALQNQAMALYSQNKTPENVISFINLRELIVKKIEDANSAYRIEAPVPPPFSPFGIAGDESVEEPEPDQFPSPGSGRRYLHHLSKPKSNPSPRKG